MVHLIAPFLSNITNRVQANPVFEPVRTKSGIYWAHAYG